jgi:hypothetical protein
MGEIVHYEDCVCAKCDSGSTTHVRGYEILEQILLRLRKIEQADIKLRKTLNKMG